MRRAWALAAVLVAAMSCTRGLERAADTLSVAPRSPASSSPGAVGSAPTPAPDGRPAVLVTSPVEGDELVSPVEVSGRAFVQDGEVTITLIDENDTPLASTRTEVSCGSGCRGTFSGRLAFFAQQRVDGAIVVYEVSPDDGTAINVVSIPVTLVPGS